MDNLSTFTSFLFHKGFKQIDENEKNRTVTYEHEGFYIQVIQDYDLESFISLSRTNSKDWQGWYDMGIVYYFISKRNYDATGPSGFASLSQFFIEHYDEIMDAFEPSKFYDTENSLVALQKEKVKVTYGF